jgi:ATP-binding cassette, subfamily B, heavy metal transporter
MQGEKRRDRMFDVVRFASAKINQSIRCKHNKLHRHHHPIRHIVIHSVIHFHSFHPAMTARPAVPDDDEWRAVASIGIFTIQMIRAAIVLVRYVDQPPSPPPQSKEEATGDASQQSLAATTASTGSSNGAGEKQPLLVANKESPSSSSTPTDSSSNNNKFLWTMKIVLTMIWLVAAVLFATFSGPPPWSNFSHMTSVVLLLEIVLLWTCLSHQEQSDDDDGHHTNRNHKDYYDVSQRLFQLALALIVWTVYTASCFAETKMTTLKTPLLYHAILGTLLLLSILWQQRYYKRTRATATATQVNHNAVANATKKTLSMTARWHLVKPYIWPDETTTGGGSGDDPDQPPSAFWNRVRAISTWGCVVLSKLCNITSPMFLGWATTALAHQDYYHTIFYSISYCFISWLGSTCKELQSLLYLKVAQAAFVQLAAAAFIHLHGLSLDWHLRKQLGGVLRSMDRGIAACDTLMTYLFLWLLPAIAECVMVCCIFALYFHYLTLAVAVFYFVFVYAVLTIVLTLWRKQFRKALTTSDNDWHDKVTDSLLNFETVKCFTAEEYELSQFRKAVSRYQAGSVNVQGSLSILNISQQVILKTCLATALTLATGAIQDRVACCLAPISTAAGGGAGCDSAFDDCCQTTTLCGGMQVGDFVAVLTYTLNLFAPLSFLGSVYNSIIMATIDLGNMSDLLAEQPDVVDAPDALELPRDDTDNDNNKSNDTAAVSSDIAVEFDNVYFHYPTQSADRGLKGLSFQMKRGTTTAIVGPVSVSRRRVWDVWWCCCCCLLGRLLHVSRIQRICLAYTHIQTGAGKTTVSRLLFRFYDVLGGAVKVHGLDVRSVTQRSLRAAIGVVPQTASMFNDTIRSNIWYGNLQATEAELVQAATDAQLLQFIESLDDGWDTMVGDRGLKLSGGERQRAAIARCLLKVTFYFHYIHVCVRSPSIHPPILFFCTSTNN